MTYKWEIEDLIKKPSADGLSEVVTHVPFACTATNDEGKQHTYHHLVKLPPPSEETFTDFESLTEEQVIGWVKSQVDLDFIYGVIAERIAMTPGDGVTMPWGNGRHDNGGEN